MDSQHSGGSLARWRGGGWSVLVGILSCRALLAKDKAFKIFTIFDDDQNDSLDYHEFLKHIFPKES